MSKKKNDINTHVGMSGVEDVVDNMEKIGDAGDKTAKRVKKSSQKASKGLQTMDHAAKEVRVTIEKLGGNAGRLGNFLSKLGPGGIAAAAGIGAVALAMHRGLPLYIKTEESLQRFGATLEFAGKHAGISAKEVEDFANAMEKSTRVSADQVMNASSTLLAFDRIQGETLMRTQEAAINLSQVLGRDLQGITEKLGRAMQLPLEEMKALKEVGITISLSEEERIRRMVEANDILGAQDAILSKIEDKVGNVAHQLGTEGIGASFHQMGVAYEDALKSFISFVDYAIDLKGITESIADTLRGLTDTFQTLSDQTIEKMEQERKKLEVTIATLKQSEEAGNKEAKERLAYVQIEHDHMSKLIPLKEKHMNLEKRIASFQQFKKHGLIKGEGSTKIKEFISGLKKEFESLSQQIDALNKKKLSAGSFLGMAGMGAGIGNMTSSFTGSNSGAGSALGAVGGAIGSIYGPIGFVAGSAIGGALGGMIGGDPSSNISEFLGTTTNNGLQNVSFGSKNMGTDAAEELAATFSQVIRSFEQSGIDIGNHQVIGSIHSGGSSFKVEESGIHIGFDSNDAESVNSAMATLSVELARLADISNNSLSIALENITTEGRSLEEVLSDLSFAAHFDELGGAEEQLGQFAQAATQLHEQMGHAQDTATRLGLSLEHLEGLQTEQLNEFFDGLIGIQDVLSPTEQAIEALATRFDDLREAAEITGYSVESINEAQARDEAILRGNFVRDLTNAWLQETDPMLASINALQQDYQQQLRDAQLLGISDIALIHELHYERMTDLAEQSGFLQEELAEGNNTLLLEQRQIQDDLVTSLQEQSRTAQTLISQYQSISSSIDRFLSQSEFGAASFDTPLTQFQKIEAQFKQLLPQAQLGNIEAQQQLIEIAPLFRDLNRSVHGATAEGAANALELTTAMENVGDVADRQVSLQEQLISQHSIELSTLQGIETGTDGVIQSVNQMSSAVIAQFNQFFSSYQGGSTQDFGINAALNRQLAEVTGFRDNFGGGSFIQFMQTMNDNDPRRQAARQVMSTSGFIPGFANGGQPPIGTPFWVGEYGPELMVARSQHQVYSNTQSHQMVQQGSESPAMVSRLDNLISLNLELLDLLRQGQRVEQKQLDDIGDSLHGIHRQSKRGVRV